MHEARMLKDDAKAGQQAGTSIATAVAAGIAAILLSYARVLPSLLPDQIGKEELSRLWTPEGMRALCSIKCRPLWVKASGLSILSGSGWIIPLMQRGPLPLRRP